MPQKIHDVCDNYGMDFTPLHFLDQPIEVTFDEPLKLEKNPDMPPNGFIWEGRTYRVVELLASWNDFKRRGRMARNMQPQHAAVASTRGSLNVGRYYFRVRVVVHPAGYRRARGLPATPRRAAAALAGRPIAAGAARGSGHNTGSGPPVAGARADAAAPSAARHTWWRQAAPRPVRR